MEVHRRGSGPTKRQQEIIDLYRRWDPHVETINQYAARHNLTRSRIYQVLRECNVDHKVYNVGRESGDDAMNDASAKALTDAVARAIRLARATLDGKAPPEFVRDELAALEAHVLDLMSESAA